MIKNRYLVVASVLFAMAASSSAWAQQYARPNGVQSAGTWTAVNAGTHHEAVNEASFDDGDWIDSGLGNDSTIIFTLDDITDPGSYANNHIIRYRCRATVGNKPKGGEGCDAALYLGNTQIATTNVSANRGAFAPETLTIVDASALAGANYANLEIRITSSSLDVDESIQVSWVELEVPAASTTVPSVTTNAATGVTQNQATLGGNVSDDGGDPLLDPNGVGVYLHTAPGAEAGTRYPFASVPAPPYPKDFSGVVGSLSQGTTYYFKAYAENSIGETIATNEQSFTTWDVPTLLATPTVTNVQPTSATLGGTVTADGFTTVTECGVTWGTVSGPGPYANSATAASCDTNVAFTVGTGETLTKGVTYYFRSYATNAVGTVYSANQGSFKPADVPQLVATVDLPSVTDTQAPLGGDITDDGGDTVTAVGIYWDTDGVNTRNDGIHVPMTVADPFEEIVTGLPPGSTIYFFAYATNGAGTTDSSIINFPTQAGAPTMEPTPTVANIVGDGANLGGTMASDGGGTNLDCGVELAAAPGGPYGAPQSFGVCTAGTPFAVSVSGLISGQTYYFRAYATSDAGSDYSDEDSFIPQAAPTVTSAPAANPTHNSADLGGTVVSDEGSAVTERGIVWDLNPNPEGQPTKTTVPMGSGTGAFEQTVSLPSGTTIYFEAYATNASGTAYSNDGRSVDTLTQPTVQASSLVLTPFGRSIRATWTRGNGDGSLVAVWQEPTYSMDPPSDLTDYIAQPDYSLPPPETSTGSGNFVVYKGSNNTILVTGLDLSTTYYFAVYEYAGEGTNSDYIQISPATDFVATTDLPQHNYDYRVNCEECHKHGTQRPRQTELENKCKTCHDAGGLASTKREFKNHLLPSRNVDIDYVDCGMCHELHKQSSYNTTKSISFIDSTERVNKSFLRANVSKYVANAAEPAVLHDDVPSGHIDQPKREENNPNNDPVQPADTPQRAVEGGNDTTARGYCQVCHTLTAYHRSNEAGGATTVSAYDKNGFMQCHDGSTENAACATDVNCGDCHEHNNSFIGVNNNLPCQDCHNGVVGSRPIITTQFDTANVLSSHIPNGTPTEPDCKVCHDQGTHTTGYVRGLDVDDTGDPPTSFSHPDPRQDTLATGVGEVYAPHCLSCHDSGVAAGAASLPADAGAPTVGQTQNSPFINSDQPPEIDATAWSTASHNIPTPSATPMTCIGDGANGCHASGHGTNSNSLLAAWNGGVGDPATNAPESPRQFCYNCHDGTISTIDIQQQFIATAPVEITGTDYLTVNKQHDVFPADQTFSGMAEADFSCKDCHQPHVNSANDKDPTPLTGYEYLNSVANPDTGAPLPLYNPANHGGGDNVVDPKNTGWEETDTIEFCLACHDGTMPNGVTMPGGMIDMVASWAGDQHGAHSDRATTKGWLKYPFGTAPQSLPNVDADYDGTTPYSAMNCTTCHGAHGSENIFNLRSSITVAGVQMSTGTSHGTFTGDAYPNVPGTEYIFPIDSRSGLPEQVGWGAWCSFCHDVNHDTKTGLGCQGSHMHGGGSNGNF